jgi:Pvc16 N-terminal domain
VAGMIHDVDESLRALTRRDVLNGAKVDISFEAPTKEWSARRNSPTLNLYLYDIREDLARRMVQHEVIRNDDGFVTDRVAPPRRFKLSYLVTAWTQRPEDEHRLLSAVLACFVRFDALPSEVLQGDLAGQPYPLRVTIGLPLPAERSISDVWTALGGELKPSLDLIVTAPLVSGRQQYVGPPVTEEPRITVIGRDADEVGNDKRGRGRRGTVAAGSEPDAALVPESETAVEIVHPGRGKPGRMFIVRTIPRS